MGYIVLDKVYNEIGRFECHGATVINRYSKRVTTRHEEKVHPIYYHRINDTSNLTEGSQMLN